MSDAQIDERTTASGEYSTGTELLRADRIGAIARLVFANPSKHNALSPEMIRTLPDVLGQVAADPEARVLVVEGAGDKAFCSGADISSFGEARSGDARRSFDAAARQMVGAWCTFDKPVVARIRGLCIGAGLLTAMHADIRVAAQGTRFAIPAARLGLGYEFGGIQQLIQLVGPSWASELLLTARQLSDDEALRIGLVQHVLPPAELDAFVDDLVSRIADNAPLTLRSCKVSIREALADAAHRDDARVQELYDACFASVDYIEGQEAFLQKRRPAFVGR